MTVETHDYATALVRADQLNPTHVLVGESGGLSAVYFVEMSHERKGEMLIETEHCSFYAEPDEMFTVLAERNN